MRIVKLNDGYVVYFESETWTVPTHIMHALVRLGAEWQRQRSADMAKSRGGHLGLIDAVELQPITDADITAAVEKANG